MCKGDASYASRSVRQKNVFRLGGTLDAAGTELKVYGIVRPEVALHNETQIKNIRITRVWHDIAVRNKRHLRLNNNGHNYTSR